MSEKKIVDYKLATNRHDESISKVVNDLIKEGWQPFGSVLVTVNEGDFDYWQAMVKYENI